MKYYIEVYKSYIKELSSRLSSYGADLNGLRILDIGCFTGDLIELLKENGADVYGLELQEEAVKIANKKLPGRIFQADLFSNNFPHMSFDVIMLLEVIEHAVDPIKLLKRASELLKEDGILMLETPNSTSFPSRILGKYWPPCTPIEHINLFSKKSLFQILRSLGFQDIEFKPHWKNLPIAYVYKMLEHFSPGIFMKIKCLYNLLPECVLNRKLPFYIGEMVVFARRTHK